MPPPHKRFRVVFMGTPDFALPSLEALLSGEEVIAVVTQPDRPKGRGEILTPSPVKVAAAEKSLLIFQPERIKKDLLITQALVKLAPDVMIVVAFGQILPKEVLKIPRLGCINLHPSLLPKYRGAAPIQWALIHGEKETGVTTLQVGEGVDSGPILLHRTTDVDPEETAEILSVRLAKMGADLLLETLLRLKEGTLTPEEQDAKEASIVPLLKKEDGLIRWHDDARAIFNRWRGVIPWPGTTTSYQGKRWKVPSLQVGGVEEMRGRPGEIIGLSEKGLEVASGRGYILIEKLQMEGGRPMTPIEYVKGHSIQKGSILGA